MPQKHAKPTAALWSPLFIALFLLNTLTSAGFYMTMPTLPKYALRVGMTLAQAGLLTGVFSVVAIVVRPLAGLLADRSNQKTMLIVANVCNGLAALGYSFSLSPTALFIFRILHGMSFAMSSTVQLALTSSIVPQERLGEGIGYMGISQILAMSFAPNLGLYLSESIGYVSMFRLSGATIALAGAAMIFLPYRRQESLFPAATLRTAFSLRSIVAVDLLLLSCIGSLFSLMNGIVSSYLSMLGDERGIGAVSIFFTLSSAAVLLIRPFAGPLIDKRGYAFTLIPCLVLGACAMFLVGSAWSVLPIIAAGILKGASQSAGQVAVQTECARRSSAQRRGVAMSTFYLGSDLGNSLGASAGGWMSSHWGLGSMFTVMGGVILSGLAMLFLQKRIDLKRQRKDERSHAPCDR